MELINQFLKRLDDDGIRYVHWKSNTNIDQALAGVDDLDILVIPEDAEKLNQIFSELKILRAYSEKDSWQEGITHYVGIDSAKRELVHVHLHYRLSVGYDYDKKYHLPLESAYMAGRNKYKNVFIPSVEHEFIVLVIRLILKNAFAPFLLLRLRKKINLFKTRKTQGIVSEEGYREYLDLRDRADRSKVKAIFAADFPFLSGRVFDECVSTVENNSSLKAYFSSARVLSLELREYKTHGEWKSYFVSIIRIAKIKFKSSLSRLIPSQNTRGKTPEYGGRIVAFVGGDGAGKTTTLRAVYDILGSQFKVKRVHIGRPKMSVMGFIVRVIGRCAQLLRQYDVRPALGYLAIAYDRKHAFMLAKRLRDKGTIVLLDRIPLEGVTSMDCPRVYKIANGKYKRLIKREEGLYAKIRGVDALFVLKLDPVIALKRRPEDDPDELLIRSGQIWNNDWHAPYGIEINTNENSREEVLSIVLEGLLERLSRPYLRVELVGLNGCGKSTLISALPKSYPNFASVLPARKHSILIFKNILLYGPALFRVYRRTRNRGMVRVYLYFKVSVDLMRRWEAKENSPCKDLILDEGPVFLLARAHMDGFSDLIVSDKDVACIKRFTSHIYRMRAPVDILYQRVQERPLQAGRGKFLEFEEFIQFCADYDEAYTVIDKQGMPFSTIDTSEATPAETFRWFKINAGDE